MIYCKRCIYPANHPLHITFDEKGVCSGCRIHEEKDVLDWDDRREKLRKLLESYRRKSDQYYDCVIPVSGARDSYFIVYMVKHVFGLNPLLVTYNKHYNTKVGIRNLDYLRTLLGCDCLIQTIAPQLVKKVTQTTLRHRGSIYWHCLAGQTVFPVQTAVRFKIPLIIWGAHQGCDQVGMFSHLDEVEMTRKYRKDHDLMGLEARDLTKLNPELSQNDLQPFMYPHDKEIESVGIRGIYLNNYIRWDSKKQHEVMIEKYGYETAAQRRTFDTYNDVDSFHYSDLHDYIKFLKWGYGKVTDHVCREIRLKRLTREEGIELVKRYEGLSPSQEGMNLFLNWIGMSKEELFGYIDNFRHSSIWRKDLHRQWQLTDSVTAHATDSGVEEVRLNKQEDCVFRITGSRDSKSVEDQYVLIGKGHVD